MLPPFALYRNLSLNRGSNEQRGNLPQTWSKHFLTPAAVSWISGFVLRASDLRPDTKLQRSEFVHHDCYAVASKSCMRFAQDLVCLKCSYQTNINMREAFVLKRPPLITPRIEFRPAPPHSLLLLTMHIDFTDHSWSGGSVHDGGTGERGKACEKRRGRHSMHRTIWRDGPDRRSIDRQRKMAPIEGLKSIDVHVHMN